MLFTNLEATGRRHACWARHTRPCGERSNASKPTDRGRADHDRCRRTPTRSWRSSGIGFGPPMVGFLPSDCCCRRGRRATRDRPLSPRRREGEEEMAAETTHLSTLDAQSRPALGDRLDHDRVRPPHVLRRAGLEPLSLHPFRQQRDTGNHARPSRRMLRRTGRRAGGGPQ